ncbi:hypothetical protein [Streptomyces sp. TLI_171]|uniref:hypothetical protein n=1 Tax=Streptomyces sp. TLI_171 TaxID=1938859 RepID=UPI0015D53D44|nr:hypothetical protein [Streptomyces sp. TLI_171]
MRLGLAAVCALGAALGTQGSARADGGGDVTCPPLIPDCTIVVGGGGGGGGGTGGGSGGGGDSGGGSVACLLGDTEVPCYRQGLGWFNPSDDCYWNLINPPPGPDDQLWQIAIRRPKDWKPGPDQGDLYDVTCTGPDAVLAGGVTWSLDRPPGYGGGPNLQAMAEQAVKKLGLQGADIGIAPKAGAMGLVGLPVWLWNKPTPSTWGPKSASVSAAGITVTATGHVTQIVWNMGDGTTVTCANAGTPYNASFGNSSSPDCGHTYQRTSAAGGTYPVTATSTWKVDWTATSGQRGTITTTRQSTTTVAIGQLQVLNN